MLLIISLETIPPRQMKDLAKDCRRKHVANNIVRNNTSSTNERYFFDCSVNGKPLQSYVDTGCSAVLIKEQNAKELQLKCIPCELNITGYGGSMVKVLGKTNIHLKVDCAEAVLVS
ncbi:hypothetical protein QE152_g990 [Popillia japonica]|uniref:Peptidase A2 domain-containing protein n=1 Tax=Popillia japonica TaxID=7064 RepID=A0AAW1NA36_POPJA